MVTKAGCGQKASKAAEKPSESKTAAVSRKFREGHKAGEKWARGTAKHAELRRLGKMEEGVSPSDWNRIWDTGDNDAYGAGERLVFAIRPKDDKDRQAAAAFWESAVGDGMELTDDFVQGFVDGALDVWHEVKDAV